LLKYEIDVNFALKILFTFIMLFSFYLFFHKKHAWFGTGFFIGLFWFWWIGLSFRYYGLSWMMPLIDIIIALFYAFVFFFVYRVYSFIQNRSLFAAKIFLTLMFTFGFDYITPFTFDWFKPEVLFVDSVFGVSKTVLFVFFTALIFYKELKWTSFILLAAALLFKPAKVNFPKLNIYVANTDVPQDKKWLKSYIPLEVENNFKTINKAVAMHKDVVVLPESAFPLFLNMYPQLMKKLLNLSEKITIVTGALHYKNHKYYNSTYVFENGAVKILDKHILVPFGEYIPLPFFQKEINRLFFGDASDYSTSGKFGVYKIRNYRFINAICYEATVEDLYRLSPKYVIALSNDAWFTPSIQPSLQQMLIKVFARKYGKVVYHSINGFKSYVVE
jgi:apolipoprotein N-acyltransferase